MTTSVITFLLVCTVAVLVLPRRWVLLPFIGGACYVMRSQAIEVGAASITGAHLLVAAGLIRLVLRREWIEGRFNCVDWLLIAWGAWLIVSVAFHATPAMSFALRTRTVLEAWGFYLLFRVCCRSAEERQQLLKVLALVLGPISVGMIIERSTGTNLFGRFVGVELLPALRDGVVRAQGPFAHAILAGSIGGVCLPLMMGLWSDSRALWLLGVMACAAIITTSASSGPILTAGSGVVALLLWPLREQMRLVRWLAVLMYVGLDLLMNQPAYFIISYVDLTGSSTSWYRAALIRSAAEHFDEWWLAGTDYTRHWMATGIAADPRSVDIVNHYIAMGVAGGVLLMALFIALLVSGFLSVGRSIRSGASDSDRFRSWAVGASLFAHAVTCLAVSYFDYAVIFLYLSLTVATVPAPDASIRGTARPRRSEPRREPSPVVTKSGRHTWAAQRHASTWRDISQRTSAYLSRVYGRTRIGQRVESNHAAGVSANACRACAGERYPSRAINHARV